MDKFRRFLRYIYIILVGLYGINFWIYLIKTSLYKLILRIN